MKKPTLRFLKQGEFFDEIAHAVYAHSLLSFLCDVEYSNIEHEFILVSRDALSEELVALAEIPLQNFPKDDASTLECQNYVKEHFGVALEIFNLTPETPPKLHVVGDTPAMIEPRFLTKEEIMMIVGHTTLAQHLFMEMDEFNVSTSKEVETRAFEAVSSILAILLHELSVHAPLIPACKEYVMKEYEITIPPHLF